MPDTWQSICEILVPTEIVLVVAKNCLMSINVVPFAAIDNCFATAILSIVKLTCAAAEVGLENIALVTIPLVEAAKV